MPLVKTARVLAGRDEEVPDLKVARLVGWQRRAPGGIVGEIGLRITADDADDDLGDDAATDFAKVVTCAANRGFAEDIEPQRRLILPVTEGELLKRQRLRTDGVGDRFAGWQAGTHAALQVSRGQRLVRGDFDHAGDGFRKANKRRG